MGVSKKELVGGVSLASGGGRGQGGGGYATDIYLTKHSCHECMCVYICACPRGRKRERIMVTQAGWLIQMGGGGTTRLWRVQHTQALRSSSLLPPGPPSSEGGQKRGVGPR